MVYGDGWWLPLVFTTVKVIVRIVVEGNGSDKYMNGSKVTETFLQIGQTKVDLYWPCQKKKQKGKGYRRQCKFGQLRKPGHHKTCKINQSNLKWKKGITWSSRAANILQTCLLFTSVYIN